MDDNKTLVLLNKDSGDLNKSPINKGNPNLSNDLSDDKKINKLARSKRNGSCQRSHNTKNLYLEMIKNLEKN